MNNKYSNDSRLKAKELYNTYFLKNNKNHLMTLESLKKDKFGYLYFSHIFFTTEDFLNVMEIDLSVYRESGWSYWVPGMIMPPCMR